MAAEPEQARRVDALASFYAQSLSEAERVDLPWALSIEGLDQEIATLRLRLRTVLAEGHSKEWFELMLKGVSLLVRAVSAKYKLSPGSEAQLTRSLQALLEQERELEEGGDGHRGA